MPPLVPLQHTPLASPLSSPKQEDLSAPHLVSSTDIPFTSPLTQEDLSTAHSLSPPQTSGGGQAPKWYAAKKETFQERLQETLDINVVERKLTRRNYREKFHNLICWEERKHIEILRNK